MKTSECDCVILCGGFGKRLQGVVHKVPKVLADVDGRPFLDIVIEYLKSQAIARIILCAGYKADMIERHYGAHDLGVTIKVSVEKKPLGTGGALKHARTEIASDPFFVLNGDSFCSADLQAFLDFHGQKQAHASILVAKVSEGQDFGSINIDGDGRITDFHEKINGSQETLANAGVYCFSQGVFEDMPKANAFSLEKEFFPKLAGGRLFGFATDRPFVDIGTPDRYRKAQDKFKNRKTI